MGEDSITNMTSTPISETLTTVADTLSKAFDSLVNHSATAIDTIANPDTASQIIQDLAPAVHHSSGSSSSTGLIIAIIGLMVFAAHFFAEIFSRKRVPDVLLLMGIGLLLGPIFHLVKPESFGSLGSIFSAVTLVIILFESGTQLSFGELMTSLKGTAKLTVLNFFTTMAVIGLLGWLIFKVDPLISFMLGAILGGTSSAVVIPMVQQLKMAQKSRTILILESAFSDVLCIVFALALLQAITLGKLEFGVIFGQIFSSFVLATVIGLLGAIFWSLVLDKVRHFNNSILTTPAFVFVIYGLNEFLGYSGAIAALAFGIGLANIDSIYKSTMTRFVHKKPANLNPTEKLLFGELVFLLKTFFFIYIGVSIQLNEINPLLIGLGITILLFILRIPVVKFSVSGKNDNISDEDTMYMSAMVPKGLAAAVLATMPQQAGIPGGEAIKNIVFAVILFSIIFTSVLMPLIEKSKAVSNFYLYMLNFNDKIKAMVEKRKMKKALLKVEDSSEEPIKTFDSEIVADEMEKDVLAKEESPIIRDELPAEEKSEEKKK